MITQFKEILEVSIVSFGKVDLRVYTIMQLLLVIIIGKIAI